MNNGARLREANIQVLNELTRRALYGWDYIAFREAEAELKLRIRMSESANAANQQALKIPERSANA